MPKDTTMNGIDASAFRIDAETSIALPVDERRNAKAAIARISAARNAKRLGKAGGLSLLALSLAACGGSGSNEEKVDTLSLADFVKAALADTLPEKFAIEPKAGDVGVVSIEELRTISAAVDGAVNGEEIRDLAITYGIADTAEALLAFAEANLDTLVDAGSVLVTGPAATLSVADLGILNAIGADFAAAPDVEDTLENADGAVIEGVRNLNLAVAGDTPAADAQDATITATGTGTVTFNFVDEDDTVTLEAGSSFSGFTTLAVVAGTVDVTAADLGDITAVTVASSIIMTAAQFLALDSLDGLDADAVVSIEVATAAEAAAVIDAAKTIGGTLDATDVTLVAALDSALTAGQVTALNGDLDDAITQVVADRALPQAIEKLEAADDALTAFETMIEADYDITVTTGASADIDTAISATKGLIGSDIQGGGETVLLPSATQTQARFELDLKETRDALDKAVADAENAAFSAREKLIVTLSGDEAPVKAYEAAIAVQDAAAKSVAAAATTLAAADAVVEEVLTQDVSYAAGVLTVGTGVTAVVITTLTAGDKITLNANVKPTANGYEIGGKTVAKADLDALVSAAQDKFDADAAKTAADNDVAAKEVAIGVDADPWTDTDGEKYVKALGDVDTATGNHDAFEAAYDKWVDLSADLVALTDLKDDALVLEKAVATALAEIENAPDHATVKGLDVNVVGVDDALDGPTPGSDLFLVTADAKTGAVSIAGDYVGSINIDGVDYLHFDTAYTFVELGATETINNAVGSASTLEIFAKEVGGNVELYVEKIPTAGNGSTVDDVTKLTLNDVTLADLSFDQDNSILTATNI